MLSALEELKAAGRLSASMDVAVWAEAFWATLHGIVALNLTCPVFPSAPLDTVVGVALDAWLGSQGAGQPPRVTRSSRARKKSLLTRRWNRTASWSANWPLSHLGPPRRRAKSPRSDLSHQPSNPPPTRIPTIPPNRRPNRPPNQKPNQKPKRRQVRHQAESNACVITFSSDSSRAIALSSPCLFPPRPPSATKSRLT